MDLNLVLNKAVKVSASDVHLKVGLPPMFRVHGVLGTTKGFNRISNEDMQAMGQQMMDEATQALFKKNRSADFAHSVAGLGRFRVNVFQQRGSMGVAIRIVEHQIQTIDELCLPPSVKKLAEEKRGLLLITGSTGSGKSTTMAAMIDHINSNRTAHVITVEDPIEFLIRDKRSIINQREVGVDAPSFHAALRDALRQDPDVIMVGEMRDLETIETAMLAAETGHLVISTLHTVDAVETVNRIISEFPPYLQERVRKQLANILCGVISQRLVSCSDKSRRVPAVEVMLNTNRVQELLSDEDRIFEVKQAMAEGYESYGSQTFDQSLMELYTKKYITVEEAIAESSNPDNFKLRLRGISSASDKTWEAFEN